MALRLIQGLKVLARHHVAEQFVGSSGLPPDHSLIRPTGASLQGVCQDGPQINSFICVAYGDLEVWKEASLPLSGVISVFP
jgi:hypothetical protein